MMTVARPPGWWKVAHQYPAASWTSRDTILPGTFIVVDGYQSKDRGARANGRDITFEDGRKFFMGSSGTGAPTIGTAINSNAENG